eukprot:366268-Chlamydomonas_euryale.AAC.24
MATTAAAAAAARRQHPEAADSSLTQRTARPPRRTCAPATLSPLPLQPSATRSSPDRGGRDASSVRSEMRNASGSSGGVHAARDRLVIRVDGGADAECALQQSSRMQQTSRPTLSSAAAFSPQPSS